MESPAISIIMNCLNCARDLPAALASVRAQTLDDYEIIFWDNCSNDDSGELAQAFGPKLRYFRSERVIPLGAARNQAIAEARGRLIAFLDCDDLWKPEKLAAQCELFEKNPRLGLSCTDTEIFDGKKILSRLFEKQKPQRGNAFAPLVQSQWISMSSAMVSREALDSVAARPSQWFDEELEVCEEADLFYRIAHDWEIDFVDKPLTVWRVHGSNTTFRKFAKFAGETEKILQKHKALYPDYDREYPGLATILWDRAHFQHSIDLWRNGKRKEAREHLAKITRKTPKTVLFHLATWLPGSFFDLGAKIYFGLPGFLRR